MKSLERLDPITTALDHTHKIICVILIIIFQKLVIETLWHPKSEQTWYNAWSQNLVTTHGHRNWLKPKCCSRSQDLVQQRPQITCLNYRSRKARIAEQGHSRKQSRQYVTKQGQTLLVNNKMPYMCMAIIKNLLFRQHDVSKQGHRNLFQRYVIKHAIYINYMQ